MDWTDEIGGDVETSLRSIAGRKTPATIARILAALRQYPLIGRAARMGGISPRTLLDWRHDDPELRAAVEDAKEEGIERIELRAHVDAVHGTDREGTLMRMFTLKRHRPEYRDNVTVHHQGGGQDARDAALLRRAMVESLGPYPDARAALAAALARLGGVASDDPRPALPPPRPGADDVVDAEMVSVELPAGEHQAGAEVGSRAAGGELEHGSGGGEREEPGASPRGGAGAGGGDGPVLSRPPSTPAYKGVLSFDNCVIEPHSEGDD